MMKSKRAESIVYSQVIYIVILALFAVIMFAFIYSKANGAGFWEDFYAKEITKAINLAEPGDEITIDVQQATSIAIRNGVESYSDIFRFDNENQQVCVKLSNYRRSCYSYFNSVEIYEPDILFGRGKDAGNILYFKIKEKPRAGGEVEAK